MRPVFFALFLLAPLFVAGADSGARAEDRKAASLAGKLLVAAPSMMDPRFRGTVIYMCEHTPNGALGLILNREMATVPGAAIADQFELETEARQGEYRVIWGGPVEYGRGFVLHSTDYLREDSVVVDDGVALTTDSQILVDMLEGNGPKRSLLALGYAGWAAGQLESELMRDDWITVPGDAEFVFTEDAEGMWDAAMMRLGIDL